MQKPKLTPYEEMSPRAQAMHDIADALQYPVDNMGRRYDVRYLIPVLAFHLARAGCIVDPELALIKPRRLPPSPGVIEDAVEWVDVNAEDSIDDELAGATLDDLDRLSPAARAELIRRLGGDGTKVAEAEADAPLDDRTPWHVETSIQFDDDPDS
ncbi:minor tail protein [Mycobacterium phage Findley]|uniref:Minor tail protein n=1 Tax=Mycobacterium phage Findley TaxID=2015882 RepID=A0A222ZS00_9CAUD|nr:minor tail protein [Mycobacterium phage Findley]ASR86760.1 minor tail protein [Mycobacterium phage Findley]